MEDILVPIFICCIMPVAIVLIANLKSINSDNKRSQIIIKAIEADQGIDAAKLAEALRKPEKNEREILNRRLLLGCILTLLGVIMTVTAIIMIHFDESLSHGIFVPTAISTAIGISYLIVYFVTRKQILNNKAD